MKFAGPILAIGLLSAAPFASASPGATVLGGNAASTALPTWQNAYEWPAGHGYFGFVQTADRSGYGFSQGSPSGAGLWLWPQGAQRYERGGAQWSYAAPGTTRILKATVRISYKPRLLSHHCVRASLSDGSDQRDSVVFCKPPGPSAGTGDVELRLGDPAANPTAGKLAVRIEVACAAPDPGACQKQIPASDAERAGLHTSLVDMTLVDDDDPTLYPGGVWYDLRDRYVNGRETHGLTVGATDAGSGLREASLTGDGGQPRLVSTAPCDSEHNTPELDTRICPAAMSPALVVDAQLLAEGKRTFHLEAVDVAGNVGRSDAWSVYVDRGAPGLSGNFSAAFEPDDGETTVSWDGAVDPPLADGSLGSGVAGYRYRYRRGADAWTDWQDSEAPIFALSASFTAEMISVQAQAVDDVGNLGPVAAGTVTADIPNVTSDSMAEGDPLDGEGEAPVDPEPADDEDARSAPALSPYAAAFAAASDSYREIRCPDGAPCGRYSATKAAGYALRWDLHNTTDLQARQRSNANYRYFGGNGGDCTNFASQAMKAGGMRFMRANGQNDPDATSGHDASKFEKGEGSWWSYFVDVPIATPVGAFGKRRAWEVTRSFVRVKENFARLLDYALAEFVPHSQRVRPGDIVYLNQHGTDLADIDHTQIISKVVDNRAFVSQHSPGYTKSFQAVVQSFKQRGSILGRDWQYWVLRPKYTATNLTS